MFSFNSVRLTGYIQSLNAGPLAASPYFICGALNINARNFEPELARALEKREAGAGCLFTQPAFSDRAIENQTKAPGRWISPDLRHHARGGLQQRGVS